MHAFHDDPAIKDMLIARCMAAREAGLYRQGGCHDEDEMQAGCATAVMLQAAHPRLRDFGERFGLSYAFARNLEMIYEALPREVAMLFPECAVAAVAVGAETRRIGWQLLHRTLADHEGAGHRLVAETVSDTLAFLAPLTVGGTVDIIEARAKMMRAGETLKTAAEAVGYQDHPVWDAALIAKNALTAATTTCATEASNEAARAVMLTTRDPEGAVATARRMIELLAGGNPAIGRAYGKRLLLDGSGAKHDLGDAPGERPTSELQDAGSLQTS